MRVACVKEVKNHEYRVGLTPGNVQSYVNDGHQVTVQKGAGAAAGFLDEDYLTAGAWLEDDAKTIWDWAEMMVKVKEPVEGELSYFHEGLILYAYLHLASDVELTKKLMDGGICGVGYETISKDGGLPLLKPMSEIAGRLSVQAGAKCLEKPAGGRGVLLGGVSGVRRGNVVILGGGVVGTNAARVAIGLGAEVSILDLSMERLAYLDDLFSGRVETLYSIRENVEHAISLADLVIGAVLIPGATTPRLITREMLRRMKERSVIIDVSIDQGGCIETSRPTTQEHPTFIEEGVVHYCVTNMPGAVPQTATAALTNATLSYGRRLAQHGIAGMKEEAGFLSGLNTAKGCCVNESVARSLGLPYTPPAELF